MAKKGSTTPQKLFVLDVIQVLVMSHCDNIFRTGLLHLHTHTHPLLKTKTLYTNTQVNNKSGHIFFRSQFREKDIPTRLPLTFFFSLRNRCDGLALVYIVRETLHYLPGPQQSEGAKT
jgi:hypothetical protein